MSMLRLLCIGAIALPVAFVAPSGEHISAPRLALVAVIQIHFFALK